MARSDRDSWDLATSVGVTATGVAASRALASQGPNALINDPFAEPLVRAVGIDGFMRLIGGEEPPADPNEGPEITRQQMAEQVAVRTRFFDGFFTDATGDGVRQAVILASGLDTRGYRLPWPAGTVVYEVDQPQVIEFKTTTLAELGATPTAQHRPVGIDLRDDWPSALRRSGFDQTQPTAWSAEGLLVYLPPEAQDRLFDNITALSQAGSRVATEQVPDMSTFTDARARAVAQRWRRYGLNIEMSELIYEGDRNHVVEYLTAHGWSPTAQCAADLYAANGFDLPDNEMAATFADLSYVSAVLAN